MLNISPQELLLILLVALLVVGPKRLPELGRSLGKGIRELRRAQDEVRKTIQIEMDEEAPARAGRPMSLPEAASAGDGAAALHAAVAGGDVAPATAAGTSDVSEVSRSLGRGIAELRRARKEIERTFRVDLNEPRSKAPAERPRPRPTVQTQTSPAETSPAETSPAETPPAGDVADGPVAGSRPE